MVTDQLAEEVAYLNIEVDVAIKNHMRSLAILRRCPQAKIWEEAALQYLESKGIFLIQPPKEPETQVAEKVA